MSECGNCGGTIRTARSHVDNGSVSQIRVCGDCGGHGVRFYVQGRAEETEVTGGEIYER